MTGEAFSKWVIKLNDSCRKGTISASQLSEGPFFIHQFVSSLGDTGCNG